MVSAAFAMKVKYLIELSNSLDYNRMEHNFVNLEEAMGNYILTKHHQGALNVLFIDKLDMHAQIYGSTTAPGCSPELIIW